MSDRDAGLAHLPHASDESSTIVAASSPVRRRVLFADDEPGILDGLRAVLRAQRHEWEMVFALGGPAALEEVKASHFDVVVTDMRMPVVNGAELLRQVKALQPHAVRVVLSGQTDSETAMKSAFAAHQFLAKPCDIQQLREVVRRACNLNALVSADELRALAGDLSQLPSAPRAYLAITKALASPSCSINDVASIVEREPALCAKVLQLVNSAFFGLPRSVSSAVQAANYLGTLTLRNLALAMEALDVSRQAKLPLSPRQLLDFQTNSLLVGLLGRHWFAGDQRRADEAFVAGMLRDMGHLILAAQKHHAAAESSSHATLSAYLLGLWGIPHAVVEPVAFHENPEHIEHSTLEVVDVVHIADRVAAELLPSPFQPSPPPLDLERLERLGALPARIDELRRAAKDLLIQTRELLKP